MLLIPPPSYGLDLKDHYRFCVLMQGEAAYLQSYPPLINTRGSQAFEEVRYTGKWLSLVRIREFEPEYEFAVEYRYSEAGKLRGMRVMWRRWGRWIAQAKLYAKSEGGFEPFRVNYMNHIDGEVIADPEDVPDPMPRFKTAKIYRTIQELPCAALLSEAEKR